MLLLDILDLGNLLSIVSTSLIGILIWNAKKLIKTVDDLKEQQIKLSEITMLSKHEIDNINVKLVGMVSNIDNLTSKKHELEKDIINIKKDMEIIILKIDLKSN